MLITVRQKKKARRKQRRRKWYNKAVVVGLVPAVSLQVAFFPSNTVGAQHLSREYGMPLRMVEKSSPLEGDDSAFGIFYKVWKPFGSIWGFFVSSSDVMEQGTSLEDVVQPHAVMGVSDEHKEAREREKEEDQEKEEARLVLDYVNQWVRPRHPALWSDSLAEKAEEKVKELMVVGNIEHENDPQVGKGESENTARGHHMDAFDVFEAWRDSPGHYKNLIGYKKIGVAMGKSSKDGQYYWVLWTAN